MVFFNRTGMPFLRVARYIMLLLPSSLLYTGTSSSHSRLQPQEPLPSRLPHRRLLLHRLLPQALRRQEHPPARGAADPGEGQRSAGDALQTGYPSERFRRKLLRGHRGTLRLRTY